MIFLSDEGLNKCNLQVLQVSWCESQWFMRKKFASDVRHEEMSTTAVVFFESQMDNLLIYRIIKKNLFDHVGSSIFYFYFLIWYLDFYTNWIIFLPLCRTLHANFAFVNHSGSLWNLQNSLNKFRLPSYKKNKRIWNYVFSKMWFLFPRSDISDLFSNISTIFARICFRYQRTKYAKLQSNPIQTTKDRSIHFYSFNDTNGTLNEIIPCSTVKCHFPSYCK